MLVIAAAVGAGIYIHNALNTITDSGEAPEQVDEWTGMATLTESFPEIIETEASRLSSLQDMIRTWYYNGEPASSSHLLNVLLIGEDTRGSDILEDGTNADSVIIVSINIDTKKITLTSVLRDTYAYWETEPGNEESGQFGKINGAMQSGIGTYINCVEKMYKVDIDNYVIVNFDSFSGIIDALGGVDIELTEAEINEINNPDNGNPRYANRYGGVTIKKSFEGSSGTMHLTGEQALAYCRIRYIDSDTVRADRQKQCLNQMFTQLKDSSTVTLLKVVDKLIPYVKTGFGSSEILAIARFALSEGWLSYDVEMTSVPNARINENGAGGNYYGTWCWKSDFPQDSHYLQTLLYGKSSITLAKERVDILQCNEYGFYEETLVPTRAIIYNNAYGETTTYDFQLIEEETTQSASGTQ